MTPLDLPPPLQTLFTRPHHPSLTLLPTAKLHNPSLQPLIANSTLPKGVKAGLNLLNDDYHGCHNIAQDNDTIGAFQWWHAILHRREGDWWNSKYWYQRVMHPLFGEVYPGGVKAACDFVERCAEFVDDKDDKPRKSKSNWTKEELEECQFAEIKALLSWCLKEGV